MLACSLRPIHCFKNKLKLRGGEYDSALRDFRETAHWMHIYLALIEMSTLGLAKGFNTLTAPIALF